MRRFLLASVATAGLMFAAFPALAQIQTSPTPATPPITAPQPMAPDTPEAAETQVAPAEVQAPAAETTAEAEASAEGVPVPSSDADATAQAEAAPATAPAQAAEIETPPAQLSATGATPVPASASSVCQPRTTSVHFGARGSALSQQNRDAIEYATDAASVCSLQSVTIVDSAQGRTSSRRTAAVRQTLISHGVPAERITVDNASAAAEAASTGRLDIRMAFVGVADTGAPAVAPTPAAPDAAPAIPPAESTPGATEPAPAPPGT